MAPQQLGDKPAFYLDQDMTEPVYLDVGVGVACVYSSRCPGKETANEDAAAIFPLGRERALLVVADGVGGSPAGDQASRVAVRALETTLRRADPSSDLRTAILDGIDRANKDIQALGSSAATTLAVVEVQGQTIRPYHAGDSPVLVVGQRGRLKLRTVSHSPIGFAMESGLMDEAEAMRHEDRHIVSNVVGTADMRVEVGPPLRLADRDTLLLASDGLDDNLDTEEVVERIRKGPMHQAAQRLIDEVLDRMTRPRPTRPSKPDDLTFILFRRHAG